MPTLTLASIRGIVSGLIQDQAGVLGVTARNQAIQSAVEMHSTYVPFIKSRSLTGVTGLQVNTPTGWIDDVSTIFKIEFPVNEHPPTYLEEEDFFINNSPTASTRYQIQFISSVPSGSERFRVFWTVPHTLGTTAAINTIPDPHQHALSNLAASIACSKLAAFYAQSSRSLINADSVDSGKNVPNYQMLSRSYRSDYYSFFKISEKEQTKAGGAYVDIDRTFQWGDQMFYHPRKWR